MMTYEELKKKCPAVKLNDNTVRTGVVRLSFPRLFTPNTNPDLSNYGKYSCGLIASEDAEDDTLQLLGELIDAAVEKGKETVWKGKKDPRLDTERIVELKPEQQVGGDKWSIRSTAKEKPFRKVYDIKGNDITAEDDRIYGGAYARAILRCYPWAVGDDALNESLVVGIDHVDIAVNYKAVCVTLADDDIPTCYCRIHRVSHSLYSVAPLITGDIELGGAQLVARYVFHVPARDK